MFTSARSTLRKVNKRGAGSLKRNVRCFTPSYSTNNAWSSGRKKPVLDDPVGLLAQPIKWRRPDEAVFLPGRLFTRRQLSVIEKTAAMFDTMAVPPVIYSDLLSRAFGRLQQRHPLLCVSLQSMPVLGPYFVHDENAPVFVNTTLATDSDSWRSVMEMALNTSFSHSSGSTPLVRAFIVENTNENSSDLIITAHRSIIDELSFSTLITELLAHYVALDMGETSRKLPELLPLQAIENFLPAELLGIGGAWEQLRFYRRLANSILSSSRTFDREANVSNSATTNRIIHKAKNADRTQKLVQRCLYEQVPLNLVVRAAFIMATAQILGSWDPSQAHDSNASQVVDDGGASSPYTSNNYRWKDDAINILTHTHVDLRKFYAPPIDPKHMGSLQSFLVDSWRVPRDADVWDLARHIFLTHRAAIIRGDHFRVVPLIKHVSWFASKNLLSATPALVFSEHGVVDPEALLQEVGVVDVLLGATSVYPCSLHVSSHIFGNQLRVVVTYQSPVISEKTATSVVDTALEILDESLRRASASRIPRSDFNVISMDNVLKTM